jgi:hypothetical protein
LPKDLDSDEGLPTSFVFYESEVVKEHEFLA